MRFTYECRLSPAQSGSDVGIFQGPEKALARARVQKRRKSAQCGANAPALRHCYKKDRRLDDLHTEAAGQFLITRLPTRPTLTCSEVDC
jgi:hypothetical protein